MKLSTGSFIVIGSVFAVMLGLAYYASTQVQKVSLLPYYSFNFSDNKWVKEEHPTHTVGDFSFKDQQGKTRTQKDVENTVYVADYFFVQCPGICKQMSSELQRVYKIFENQEDVKILSHTSKPEEDSMEALLGYARMYGVKDDNKWIFLTGDKKTLYKMAREQYFIIDETGDGGEDDFIHTERFALVDKNRHIRGYYDGTNPTEVDQLIKDIQELLAE